MGKLFTIHREGSFFVPFAGKAEFRCGKSSSNTYKYMVEISCENPDLFKENNGWLCNVKDIHVYFERFYGVKSTERSKCLVSCERMVDHAIETFLNLEQSHKLHIKRIIVRINPPIDDRYIQGEWTPDELKKNKKKPTGRWRTS